MSYLYWKQGPLNWPVTVFNVLTMKNLKKTGIAMSFSCYPLQYSPNGSAQWLLVKPWTSSIWQYVRYHTSTPPRPSKWPAKLVHFVVVVVVYCCPGSRLRQYGVSSSLMAATSGLWGSPGHAALGNAICIPPAHLQGLQNGSWWREVHFNVIVDFVIDHNHS